MKCSNCDREYVVKTNRCAACKQKKCADRAGCLFILQYRKMFAKPRGKCPACEKVNTVYNTHGNLGYRTKSGVEFPLPVPAVMNRVDCRFLDILRSYSVNKVIGTRERAEGILKLLDRTTLEDKEELRAKFKVIHNAPKYDHSLLEGLAEKLQASDWFEPRIYKYFTIMTC